MHSSPRFAGGSTLTRARVLRAGRSVMVAACIALTASLGRSVVAESLSISDAAGPPTRSHSRNEVPATPAPGIVQPTLVKPGASPYPTTGLPAFGGIIQQPAYAAASGAPADDEVVVSDDSNLRQASGPPKLASQPVPPRKFVPPPVAAQPTDPYAPTEPTKTARFWDFVLGPRESAPKRAAPPIEQVAPKTSVTTTAPRSQSQGNSLWSQLLGTSSPPPAEPHDTKLDAGPLANQLLLTSAEMEQSEAEELAAPSAERKPTLQDVQAAKMPATSMTISRPGWKQQLIAPREPVSDTTALSMPTDPGMVPVPTVPPRTFNGLSALWQPFTMTNDAPTAVMPVENAQVATTARLPESERVPSLLRPFYAMNPPSPGDGSGNMPGGDPIVDGPEGLAEMLVDSSLGRQLSLAANENFVPPSSAPIEAQVQRDQEPWNGQVTVQWPLMTNPFTLSETNEPPMVARQVTSNADIAQAAFQQEPLPVPSADDSADSSGKDDKKKDDKDTLVGAKSIGRAPEDNTLEFLRASTVLLAPGKSQFDIGIEYTLTENNFPILITDGMGNVVGVDDVEFKGRELTVPMELRFGLLKRVQAFVQVPVGWANVQAAINNFDEFENDGGVGDVGFGLTAQLRDAYKDCPYLIGTLAGLAPVGGDPFGVVGAISPNAPSLGNGFWAISGNLLWVQPRYDPVVLFYGFGARYQFAHDYIGIEFQPGTEFNYTLGLGFAVNERVTLSTQFFGAYIEELKANGDRVEGTIQEPMTIRMAATLSKPCNRIVEPFVAFGLTDDSISSNFGITWTF